MINCELNAVTLIARDYDLREHIPHTWASSNDNLFQSNFSAWSYCAAILKKTLRAGNGSKITEVNVLSYVWMRNEKVEPLIKTKGHLIKQMNGEPVR